MAQVDCLCSLAERRVDLDLEDEPVQGGEGRRGKVASEPADEGARLRRPALEHKNAAVRHREGPAVHGRRHAQRFERPSIRFDVLAGTTDIADGTRPRRGGDVVLEFEV